MDIYALNIDEDKSMLLNEIKDNNIDTYDKTMKLIELITDELIVLPIRRNCDEMFSFYLDSLIYCVLISIRHKGHPVYLTDKIYEHLALIKGIVNKQNKYINDVNTNISNLVQHLDAF